VSARRQQGVALIAMLAIIVMGAAWFTVRRLNAMSSDYTIANRTQNAAVLARAKQALMGYVAHQAAISGENNPGAFPCPEAPGSFNSSAGTDGKTQTPSCALPAVGRFPWRTIGSEQFVDAAGEPLWYVVASGWSKPGPLATDTTTINSNCNDPTSGLTCWNGQLMVDGVPNAAVALIIAPGAPITVPAGACAAWAQTRPNAPPPDLRNYLECENASSPADASFVTTGPNGSFNDQVIKITAAEILPLIEGAVADRFQQEFAPLMRTAHSGGGVWPVTPALPFAATFRPSPGSLRILCWLSASKVGSHTTLPRPPDMRWNHSTASGFTPPTARFSAIPPHTSIPGTVRITRAARAAVGATWFLSTMPRMPLRAAMRASSRSSRLRLNASGSLCAWMSMVPAAGLTRGGGGGKPVCANSGIEKASAPAPANTAVQVLKRFMISPFCAPRANILQFGAGVT